MNQSEMASELLRAGWMKFQPDNSQGWKFFFKRDPDPENYHEYFGGGWIYRTVFLSGRVADDIIENRYQRDKRKKAEILFRDFRDYPRG